MTTHHNLHTIVRWYDLALALVGATLVVVGLFAALGELPTTSDVVVDVLDQRQTPTSPVVKPQPTQTLSNV